MRFKPPASQSAPALQLAGFTHYATETGMILICRLQKHLASTYVYVNVLGADVMIRDLNSSTCLHMALCDHTTVDLSSFPKLRKSTPQDLDQAPAIAKVLLLVAAFWFLPRDAL